MATHDKGPSPRERLLAAADELFYSEGIHTVGIDRIIEKAGVAKGSLYYNFDGKDDLVREYLLGRHARWAARIEGAVDAADDPRDKILAVFDVLAATFAEPDYHGCAFSRAVAEAQPDSAEVEEAASYRGWVHGLFGRLANALPVSDAPTLAEQLVVLYDGARMTFQMDHDPRAAETAKGLAQLLLDASVREPADA
ncbi:TetR/AcrR family transcriptional regulator [Humibacter ginsenosidimutans]|uniref:TetR/AcrR family transcriptional regulator n=1 Tax=Humibacter ginsenosidimutans TaxID=2599293 RepID=A0A5B8M5U8_9MICO|nr:TetR/AcrR family transcriptional regulator [Humibacter ginsenosidimutans]QDZ15175.1 TetR/AcrR family transcriptional regulator [Humibacter ginsenosidimutans]